MSNKWALSKPRNHNRGCYSRVVVTRSCCKLRYRGDDRVKVSYRPGLEICRACVGDVMNVWRGGIHRVGGIVWAVAPPE